MYKIVKEYPSRGPLKQFRLEKANAFTCFRCGQVKKAKLHTTYNSDWNKLICNGCYGLLLSIYEIKSSHKPNQQKVILLEEILKKIVKDDAIRTEIKRINHIENRSKLLSDKSLKFIGTSEAVAKLLKQETNLDWSAAIIGLCKSFELELVQRIVEPLKKYVTDNNIDLSEDFKDKDFGRISKYVGNRNNIPPELGTIRHFLNTAANSKSRLETSNLLKAMKSLIENWANARWIIDKNGLINSIQLITKDYRNKAAHTEELNGQDYQKCKELIIGKNGTMWNLIMSSKHIKNKN